MVESKIELVDRLRAEGRWGEASRFKDTAVKDFRAKGMKRGEAAEAAWAAMEKAYPPLPVDDDDDEEADEWDDDGDLDDDGDEDDDLLPVDGIDDDDDRPPAESWPATVPWKNLPAAAALEEEVYWAHHQYHLVSRGGWAMASEPPPSLAACKLAVWAAVNPGGMGALLALVVCNEEGFIDRMKARLEPDEETPEGAVTACPVSG